MAACDIETKNFVPKIISVTDNHCSRTMKSPTYKRVGYKDTKMVNERDDNRFKT
jgi:hypothetical protein